MVSEDNYSYESQMVGAHRYERVGMIARWKPVHLGHQAILRAISRKSREVMIGIGSANRYNLRNPFTLQETVDMLRLTLGEGGKYQLIAVDDLDDGPRWRDMVIAMFGELDVLITDNPYVTRLLENQYTIVRPYLWIPPQDRVPVDGSLVRLEMARGHAWKDLVSTEVAEYIVQYQIDERFRMEFGLQTLAMETIFDRRG